MNRRRATILLHWFSFMSLMLLLAGGPIPALGWAFATSALMMTGIAIARGLMSGPGPKLEGWLRHAHPWLSRGMYALLAFSAGLTIAYLLGWGTAGIRLSDLYFVLMSVASLHGIFHLWRHTALGDGAFRRMTPKALHGLL